MTALVSPFLWNVYGRRTFHAKCAFTWEFKYMKGTATNGRYKNLDIAFPFQF